MAAFYITIFLFIFSFQSSALENQSWVVINNQAVNISKSNCRLKFGLKPNDNLCKCCLAKGLYKDKSTPTAVLRSCIKWKSCTMSLLQDNLQLDVNASNDANIRDQMTTHVPFVQLMNFESISFKTPIKIHGDGSYLNENQVQDIIHYLSQKTYISLKPQQIAGDCLQIKSLTEGKGYNTGQLFSIKVNQNCGKGNAQWNQVYIFKEVKLGLKELLNLERIKNYPKIKMILGGKGGADLPIITTDLMNFKMPVGRNKMIYFSLLQSANGKPLSSWIKEYGEALENPGKDLSQLQETMEELFHTLGYQLSKMHQYLSVNLNKKHTIRDFLKDTIIHGDFHPNNVFYDAIEKKVYLIDNESMAQSLKKPLPGTHELAYLYVLSTFKTIAYKASGQFKTNLMGNIPDRTWHRLWQKLFVGYISAYPKETWEQVEQEVKKSFVQHLYYLKSTNFSRFFDKRFLALLFGERGRRKELVTKSLPVMFENVHQELMGKNPR